MKKKINTIFMHVIVQNLNFLCVCVSYRAIKCIFVHHILYITDLIMWVDETVRPFGDRCRKDLKFY